MGDQREGASPVQVESSLQRREQGQKRLPEAGDTSGPVGDKVAPSGEKKLKFSEITFAGGEPAEVASHSSLIGDDVGISGVGLGLPTVGIAGPIHGQARDVEDPLVSLPQKRQQERRTSTGLVGSPHDVLGHREDLVDELQEIHLVVFDLAGEHLRTRRIEHAGPVELLARVYVSPDFTHDHLQRTIASLPSETPPTAPYTATSR